jgi:hypothetical protein
MEEPLFEIQEWQLDKAKRALKVAKALEATQLKNGAKYKTLNTKTRVLKKSEDESN